LESIVSGNFGGNQIKTPGFKPSQQFTFTGDNYDTDSVEIFENLSERDNDDIISVSSMNSDAFKFGGINRASLISRSDSNSSSEIEAVTREGDDLNVIGGKKKVDGTTQTEAGQFVLASDVQECST